MRRRHTLRLWGVALAGLLGILALGSLLWFNFQRLAPEEEWFVEAFLPDAETFGLALGDADLLATRGTVNMLVIFTQFQGQHQALPSYAYLLFQPELKGSFTHFFNTMSANQLQVQGTVLPTVYTSESAASTYVAASPTEEGGYGRFVQEILDQVDADYDLGEFDNDGPDGVPDSGDDDGVVDYICVILCQKPPPNFIFGTVDGYSSFGFETYVTKTKAANGEPLRILSDGYHGQIISSRNFTWVVSVMAHEFGHAFGLPDLYDRSHVGAAKGDPGQPAEAYSAGIGKWGLMGLGAQGWHNNDGPNPFCAWSLEQLGWIGPDNERLIEVRQDTTGVRIADRVADLIPLFEAGYRLLLLQQYETAAYCFDYITRTFASRELLNNAGVARTLQALSLFKSGAQRFVYPFELDAATRLRAASKAASYGESEALAERRDQLLQAARRLFEQARQKDLGYVPAQINRAAVAVLQGEADQALLWSDRALQMAVGADEGVARAHAHLVRGIAGAHTTEVDSVAVRRDFEAARLGTPTLAALNLAALAGETSLLATTDRPEDLPLRLCSSASMDWGPRITVL